VIDDVQQTIERCVAAAGETGLAIIHEGPYVVPVYRPN